MLNFNSALKTSYQSNQFVDVRSAGTGCENSGVIQAESSQPTSDTVLDERSSGQISTVLVRNVVQSVQMADYGIDQEAEIGRVNDVVKLDVEPSISVAANIVNKPFPSNKVHGQEIIRSKGRAYAVIREKGNPYVLPVGNGILNSKIRDDYQRRNGKKLNKQGLDEIICDLKAYAEKLNTEMATYSRVADFPGGVIIDLDDESRSQVRITAGKVETITSGSEILFCRSPFSLTMRLREMVM